MGRANINIYTKIFTKLILETTKDYVKINFSKFTRDKGLPIFKDRQLRYFFKENKDRFEITYSIRLKDPEEQSALDEWVERTGYTENALIKAINKQNALIQLSEPRVSMPIRSKKDLNSN